MSDPLDEPRLKMASTLVLSFVGFKSFLISFAAYSAKERPDSRALGRPAFPVAVDCELHPNLHDGSIVASFEVRKANSAEGS
jgi:hypothetical protein